MNYTDQQKEVIYTRNRDILVSAGAGSGKTAVLTQRIMERISEEGHTDVDRLLVLTFTRAAAAQMKQRLQDKIGAYLLQHPDDENMQRQESLLHNAQITTIDSFCLYLVRNHFHRIGIDPAFRIADNAEIGLMEQQALEEVLEEAFTKAEEGFLFVVDALNPEAKEKELESSILELYHYAQSHPWPRQWLQEVCMREDEDEDSREALYLVISRLDELMEMIGMLEQISGMEGAPHAYAGTFEADGQLFASAREELSALLEKDSEDAQRKACEILGRIAFSRLPAIKKEEKDSVDESLKKLLSDRRTTYKKETETMSRFFISDPDRRARRQELSMKLCRGLVQIVLDFSDRLMEIKKEKNAFGFSDIEHMALEILYENGQPSDTALSYRDYFDEVMVDEYQDSNMVQEILLSALARKDDGKHNRFMVGDKKQSIYRFRMARPEIFNEKLSAYAHEEANARLILLNDNFRSRNEVLGSVNRIFSKIMRASIGGVDYDASQALRCGMDYPVWEGREDAYETELLMVQSGKRGREKRIAEYAMITERIRSMVGRFMVKDETKENGLRPLQYRDIVILARGTSDIARDMKQYMTDAGIPVHTEGKSGFYGELSVKWLMDLLACLQNPYHDLTLVASLRSCFFNLTDEELALIRGREKKRPFFTCLKEAAANSEHPAGEGARRAMEELAALRRMAGYMSVPELLTTILARYHYREYLLGNADCFWGAMIHHGASFTEGAILCAMNELSNHDHSRFLTRTNKKVGRVNTLGSGAADADVNKAVMREAVMIQMTWPGAPTIYYGDEAGVCGFTDPDNRRTYPWGNEDQELIEFHRQMIRIHKENQELLTGSLKKELSDYNIISYARFNRKEGCVILINNNDHPVQIPLSVWDMGAPLEGQMQQLALTDCDGYTFENLAYKIHAGKVEVSLKATAGIVLKYKMSEEEADIRTVERPRRGSY